MIIMISRKGIQRAQLEPSGAKLSISITTKATDIRTHHLEAEHLVIEVVSNRTFKVLPTGVVIACPVETEFAGTEGRTAGDDEGSDVF